MATEAPGEALGPNPLSPLSPPRSDRPMTGSSNKNEVSVDTSATVSDQAVRANGNDSSPKSCPFRMGEIVLAKYRDQLYEAKILKVGHGPCWRFLVHYTGWKKTYDEWLLLDQLMKDTEENRKYMEDLNRMQKIAKSGSKPKIGTGARGRKRKAGSAEKDKPTSSSEKILPPSSSEKTIPPSLSEMAIPPSSSEMSSLPPSEKVIPPSSEKVIPPSSSEKIVTIAFPCTLKKQLLDEFDCVNKSDKLVKLPRSPSAAEVLRKYEEYRLKKDPRSAETLGDIVNGLRDHFDKSLFVRLLYKSEYQQYEEATANDVTPSTVYGAEHLLRLFVILPEMWHGVGIDETQLADFQQIVMDLLRFLQKNQAGFFLGVHQYSEQPATSENRKD